ncbi:MAG: arginine--tRNA ligase [Candidatus Omnitrophica bacterium]|nr:arginine--tRNA ligase [Candidatus Omnitrophota bacterium]
MRPYLNDVLNECLRQAVARLEAGPPRDALRWEIPKDPSFGDLSCPVAFHLAAKQRQAPAQVAQRLVELLQEEVRASSLRLVVDRFEAKSGFVNLILSQGALLGVLRHIRRVKPRYGASRLGRGRAVVVEFVSANPTGPLSVAHGRQAAVGDALARLLRCQGHRVTEEYYLNDEGHQIDLLGQSERACYLQQLGQQAAIPEEGYQGVYVMDSAGRLKQAHGDSLRDRPVEWFTRRAKDEQLARIREDLERFGLRFDVWTSQKDLRTSGKIEAALKRLEDRGHLFQADGATWFASTKFGDDKDRVVRKQSGELTYLAPDIAYHQWKFQRGYARLINLWGPDHHGYIARLKAAVSALGLPAERLTVKIVQLVTLSRHGKPVPMSKRQGEFVTFREILDEVGVDATRFFYLMRTMESHLDFDLDLAKSRSNENPVYYVQYAHARIWSILRYARRQLPWWKRVGPVALERLTAPEERLLMRQLLQFPMVLAACSQALEPHGLTTYLQRLAEQFHIFYDRHRVITGDVALSRSRLALIEATRWVLANGLGVLGISAPKHM